MKLLTSASKIVFIILAATASAGFILGKLPTDQFMLLTGMAFSFYFSNKGETAGDYAGK